MKQSREYMVIIVQKEYHLSHYMDQDEAVVTDAIKENVARESLHQA